MGQWTCLFSREGIFGNDKVIHYCLWPTDPCQTETMGSLTISASWIIVHRLHINCILKIHSCLKDADTQRDSDITLVIGNLKSFGMHKWVYSAFWEYSRSKTGVDKTSLCQELQGIIIVSYFDQWNASTIISIIKKKALLHQNVQLKFQLSCLYASQKERCLSNPLTKLCECFEN